VTFEQIAIDCLVYLFFIAVLLIKNGVLALATIWFCVVNAIKLGSCRYIIVLCLLLVHERV